MTPPVVLFSAGLDSAVLLADAIASNGDAQPVYVASGLAWEHAERDVSRRLLERILHTGRGLVTLSVDMRDVYPATHWAIRGEAPGFDTPDTDVYIDGRNIVLLSKTAVYAARAGLSRIQMGTLADNPFPDGRPSFFSSMAAALTSGLDTTIAVETPFSGMHKEEVIRRGLALGVPFELTLSCMQPEGTLHCGRCSKCRERRDAFRGAGLEDPAIYASVPKR